MKKVFSSKKVLHDNLLSGIDKLADIVGSTMGPKGRTVLIQQYGKTPFLTKDGVTVAASIDLEEPFENAAAQFLKQAAQETASVAGDGTSTSVILTREMVRRGLEKISQGQSPVKVKRQMDKALDLLLEKLDSISYPVKTISELKNIATISANNDSYIGDLIGEAIESVGKDGAISLKEGRQFKTKLEIVDGFRVRCGLVAGALATDERTGTLRYNNPLFLVTDEKISSLQVLMPALELASREKRPLFIVADDVSDEALAALITNAVRGTLQVAAVKPTEVFGGEKFSLFEDIALATGATFFSQLNGNVLANIKLPDFGTCQFVESSKMQTVVQGGKPDAKLLSNKINSLKKLIEETDDLDECEKIQERIARLASGIAIIHIGGSTEVEITETKHRIEDALEAVKSAQEEGVVIGGGNALLQVSKDLQRRNPGEEIVFDSCVAPFRTMCENADIDVTVNRKLPDEQHGLNIKTNEVENFFEKGILDPVKVTKTALKNAVSVAGSIITTNHAVIEVKE